MPVLATVTQLRIEDIRTDGDTQSRIEKNLEHLENLKDVLIDGGEFDDPILVYFDGEFYWLVDGFHRLEATILSGRAFIDAIVESGDRTKAIEDSCGVNAKHGLPRTNADKRNSVNRLIALPHWQQRSNREVARKCGVTHTFVNKIRPDERNGNGFQKTINQPVEPVYSDNDPRKLRVTNEDKRTTIEQYFTDTLASEWESNVAIAEKCGVTEGTVRNYKKKLQEEMQSVEPALVATLEPLSLLDFIQIEQTCEPKLVEMVAAAEVAEPEPEPAIEPELTELPEMTESAEPEPEPVELVQVEPEIPQPAIPSPVIEVEPDLEPELGLDPEPDMLAVETVEPAIEAELVSDERQIVPAEPSPVLKTEIEPALQPDQHAASEPTTEVSPSSNPMLSEEDCYQQPEQEEIQALDPQPVYHPSFEQWQQDNIDLGLDAFADPIREEVVPPVKSATLMALQSSESNEWFTPAQYVEASRELMGNIDLDPASNALANEVVQATDYYDVSSNGLDKEWRGRVWLNPPYGRDGGGSNQEVWSRRLIEQYNAGITTEAVLLVNANTEAKWFQPLYDYLICFTNHRIRFYNTSGESSQPTQGNAFIYFGAQQDRFRAIFKQFGVIMQRFDCCHE
jgi:hypothetical protein